MVPERKKKKKERERQENVRFTFVSNHFNLKRYLII